MWSQKWALNSEDNNKTLAYPFLSKREGALCLSALYMLVFSDIVLADMSFRRVKDEVLVALDVAGLIQTVSKISKMAQIAYSTFKTCSNVYYTNHCNT